MPSDSVARRMPPGIANLYVDVKYLDIVGNMLKAAGKTSRQSTSGVHLWLLLMKAHRAMGERAMASIAETGMCFTDFTILEILLHKGKQPVNTLAARVGLTSGSGTTAVDRLEKRGLVERRSDAHDRRARVIHLTAPGRRLIARAFDRHAADMEDVAAPLSQDERGQLAGLLRRMGKGEIKDDVTKAV